MNDRMNLLIEKMDKLGLDKGGKLKDTLHEIDRQIEHHDCWCCPYCGKYIPPEWLKGVLK